jgi:hypothetical protein
MAKGMTMEVALAVAEGGGVRLRMRSPVRGERVEEERSRVVRRGVGMGILG